MLHRACITDYDQSESRARAPSTLLKNAGFVARRAAVGLGLVVPDAVDERGLQWL